MVAVLLLAAIFLGVAVCIHRSVLVFYAPSSAHCAARCPIGEGLGVKH